MSSNCFDKFFLTLKVQVYDFAFVVYYKTTYKWKKFLEFQITKIVDYIRFDENAFLVFQNCPICQIKVDNSYKFYLVVSMNHD